MVRVPAHLLAEDAKTKICRTSVCLVRMGELVMAFDQFPPPEIVGQAMVALLRNDQIPEAVLPYLDVIRRADWRWSQSKDEQQVATFEKEGLRQLVAVVDVYPLFMTGLSVMRGM